MEKKATGKTRNFSAISTRYPKEVRDTLKKYAKEDHRSFNGEVIHILQNYITEREKRSEEGTKT